MPSLKIVGSITLTVRSDAWVDRLISLEIEGDFPEYEAQSVLDGYYEAAESWDTEIDLSGFSAQFDLLDLDGLPLTGAPHFGL